MHETSDRGTRASALARIERHFDRGEFLADLARRVAIPTASQEPGSAVVMERYFRNEIGPVLDRLGYEWSLLDDPVDGGGPFLVARQVEGASEHARRC
ncbi:MAG: hypothetical protein R2715_22370 [Ilumatobacteraceae bacterium]